MASVRSPERVAFAQLTTAASTANVSLASVVPGAVTDYQGTTNPDGAAAIGSAHGAASPGGTTQAPDLESFDNLRRATGGTTASSGERPINFSVSRTFPALTKLK